MVRTPRRPVNGPLPRPPSLAGKGATDLSPGPHPRQPARAGGGDEALSRGPPATAGRGRVVGDGAPVAAADLVAGSGGGASWETTRGRMVSGRRRSRGWLRWYRRR